ncbi:hypothetical protein TorRG33x02_358480, partial [Trema orientale]
MVVTTIGEGHRKEKSNCFGGNTGKGGDNNDVVGGVGAGD